MMPTLLRKLKSIFVYGAASSSTSNSEKNSQSADSTLKVVSSFLKVNLNPEEEWTIVGNIGDGAYGKIYKAQNKSSKTLAALKQVAVDDEENMTDFCLEVKVLGRVQHRNVVKLYDAFYYQSKIWMFLEYCQIGSVDSVIQELERPLTEQQIRCIVAQLCQALAHLHDNCYIIHRDVKAANVLLTLDACVKLADFGVSAICAGREGGRRSSFLGSPYWMAPEVITCEVNKEQPYDFKVDVWSTGIMLIELAQMDPPWNEVNHTRVTLKILRNPAPSLNEPHKWSEEFNDFLHCCLQKKPEDRKSASELLNHPFLNSGDKDVGPLKELIAEVSADVQLEYEDVYDRVEDLNNVAGMDQVGGGSTDDGQVYSKVKKSKREKGEYIYRSSVSNIASDGVITTNIDEELMKALPFTPTTLTNSTTVTTTVIAVSSATPATTASASASTTTTTTTATATFNATADKPRYWIQSSNRIYDESSKNEKTEDSTDGPKTISNVEKIKSSLFERDSKNKNFNPWKFRQAESTSESKTRQKEPNFNEQTLSSSGSSGNSHLSLEDSAITARDSKYDNDKMIPLKDRKSKPDSAAKSKIPETKNQSKSVNKNLDSTVIDRTPDISSSKVYKISKSHIISSNKDSRNEANVRTLSSSKNSNEFKEDFKMGLFGALASKKRLIGRSVEEVKALDLYKKGQNDRSEKKSYPSGGDSNDGDVSSSVGANNDVGETDEDEDGRSYSSINGNDWMFRREKPRYRSLTKTRQYTYDGRTMTSRTSRIFEQGREDRSKMDRYNRKVNMRAMQFLQMREHRQQQNLLQHFKQQMKDLQKNFDGNVKSCLKSYSTDLEKLSREHKQLVIKLELQHDHEFNFLHKKIKDQQEKDVKSLCSTLKREVLVMKDELVATNLNKKDAKLATERKEIEHIEILRTYSNQQREQMMRIIDQQKHKQRQQMAKLERKVMMQKHDLLRACEGSIWRLEEDQLTERKQLLLEQNKQMFDLQIKQTQLRHEQELEQMVQDQSTLRSEMLKKNQSEEKELSKLLKQQKRERTHLFREALKTKSHFVSAKQSFADSYYGDQGGGGGDDGSGAGADSGYLSLEREQIKEFERKERRRIDESFREQRLVHKREIETFDEECAEAVRELKAVFYERQKQLTMMHEDKLIEEERRQHSEFVEWQRSLVSRKKAIEDDLKRQKEDHEKFYYLVLRGSLFQYNSNNKSNYGDSIGTDFYDTLDHNFQQPRQQRYKLGSEDALARQQRFNSLDDNLQQRRYPRRREMFQQLALPHQNLQQATQLQLQPELNQQAEETRLEDQYFQGRYPVRTMYQSTPDFINFGSDTNNNGNDDDDDDDDDDDFSNDGRAGEMIGNDDKDVPRVDDDDILRHKKHNDRDNLRNNVVIQNSSRKVGGGLYACYDDETSTSL